MLTIDNLQFLPMDSPEKKVFTVVAIQLPNGVIIPPDSVIYLSHAGIHAIVKYRDKTYKF